MKHHKIPKSRRHKKIKGLEPCLDDKDNMTDEEDDFVTLTKQKAQKEKKKISELKQQKMPKRLQEMLDRGKAMNSQPKRKRSRTKSSQPGLLAIKLSDHGDERGATRGRKWLPDEVVQGPYETQDQFLNRIHVMSAQAKNEARIENRFDIDLCPKILSTTSGKEKQDEQSLFGEKKRQKRRDREAKKKEKMKAKQAPKDYLEFGDLTDQIEFGEVALAPPRIVRKRKIKS
ncbi:hypothetical protein HDE_11778 [Halotydeus destructor]|nr:hypothetical protein HDE_11778 [Halotydeus destructor]